MSDLVSDLRSYSENDDVPSWVRNDCKAAAGEIERLRAEITAEREACAKIVDEYAKELGETGVLPRIAGAIRARGETKT